MTLPIEFIIFAAGTIIAFLTFCGHVLLNIQTDVRNSNSALDKRVSALEFRLNFKQQPQE